MNVEDLREQLEQLAGPQSVSTPDAREGVRRRVRRSRRRMRAVSALSVAVIVAAVAAGVHVSGDSPIKVKTVPSSVASRAKCSPGVETVAAKDEPRDVVKWARFTSVVGHGALWTVRSAFAVPPSYGNGTWSLKFPWLTRPFGIPKFTGRRLDGAGTFHSEARPATDERGTWVVSSLDFSALGCWEVTARYGNDEIVFRVRVDDLGTIAGTLRMIGGRGPGVGEGIPGAITITDASGRVVSATADRNGFSVDVPVGTYTVTGTSPQYNGGLNQCGARAPVSVIRGRITTVDVFCPIR